MEEKLSEREAYLKRGLVEERLSGSKYLWMEKGESGLVGERNSRREK